MKNLKEKKYREFFKELFFNTIFVSFFLLMLFGRAFTGIIVFGFRLGELLIGLGLLISIFIFFLKKNNKYLHEIKITNTHKLLILSFLIPLYFSSSSFLATYTYKSSSYIWTIAFIYIGYFLFGNNDSNLLFKLVKYVLPLIYFFNTFMFPNFIFNFFKRYSDKFDYIKASDILLIFVLINFLNKKIIKDDTKRFYSFILSLGFFAPLMSFMSRGGFVALLFYALIEFIQIRKFIFNNILKFIFGIFILVAVFSFSTINVTSDTISIIDNILDESLGRDVNFNLDWLNFGTRAEEPPEPKDLSTEQILENAKKVRDRRGQNIVSLFSLGSFSLDAGAGGFRLYSEEPLANWRLQLWQDIVTDISEKNLIFTGYGYSDIIPAMKLADNNGNDSTNENVHNYLIQSYARGGIVHIVLLIFLNLFVLLYWKRNYGNYKILQYMLPILLVSMFDPSMESVRFPIIYYTFLGYFLKTGLKQETNN